MTIILNRLNQLAHVAWNQIQRGAQWARNNKAQAATAVAACALATYVGYNPSVLETSSVFAQQALSYCKKTIHSLSLERVSQIASAAWGKTIEIEGNLIDYINRRTGLNHPTRSPMRVQFYGSLLFAYLALPHIRAIPAALQGYQLSHRPVSIDPTLNRDNFKKCGNFETLPAVPAGATLNELERIANKFHTPDSAFSVSDIREVIRRIQVREQFQMVPSDATERERWYRELEHVVLNVVGEMRANEENPSKKSDILTALSILSEMRGWCGSEWKMQSMTAYKLLRGTLKPDAPIEEVAHSFVAQFRDSIVRDLSRPQFRHFNEDINPHVLNEATFRVHQLIRLPGGNAAYEDPGLRSVHRTSYIDKNYFPRKFFQRYTSESILTFFDELINGIKADGRKTNIQLNRDKLIDWFRKKVGDEKTYEIYDTDIKRSNCIKKEAIAYFLRQIGVFNKKADEIPEASSLKKPQSISKNK